MTSMTQEIPDFTGRQEPIQFKIHGEVFEALPVIPTREAFRLMDLGRAMGSSELSGDQTYERLAEFFERTLLPDSAATFTKWLDSAETPIGMDQAMKLMQWLMEQWGLSPTQPSSESPETPGGTGQSSAATALPTESPTP